MEYGRKRPPRLHWVFSASPLYFVTVCVHGRRPVLANPEVHAAFLSYATQGAENRGVCVGRYVIMPDHVHLFVRGHKGFQLKYWVRGLKRVVGTAARRAGATGIVWQEGFFDHVLRSTESYSEKWHYVRQNPVRAGLTQQPEEWPYAGEIVPLEL